MRYASRTNVSAQGPKRNSPFPGFVAIVLGAKIRLEASPTETKYTAGNVEALVARIDGLTKKTKKEASCFFIPPDAFGKQDRSDRKPELLVGRGGQPYIRFSSPDYVPQVSGRAKLERITD